MTFIRSVLAPVLILAALLSVGPVHAQQELRATLFAEADRAQAAAKAANAELLAPATFDRGATAYMEADADLQRGRNLDRIRSTLATATKAFKDAEFKRGIVANMSSHPEWDPVLFPEKYLPKEPPSVPGATTAQGPVGVTPAVPNPSAPLPTK